MFTDSKKIHAVRIIFRFPRFIYTAVYAASNAPDKTISLIVNMNEL
ncbi:hypothetical protein ANACAC_02839 [Anaerostipes caccae L1-92]|uniref:Uncharacterized protein n=1 Tax=Anaerostipes caccae (strain DSM 14662 / CCUG 47493 / JCM 13470 / NCIMB 13811 / L1-92) TaxID=411490 RepID=B0MH77_ANACD|nr:hypothetical protein ANACAC_02839 [Anaerostipes caccae L1-92]